MGNKIASREEIAKRVRRADREGYEPMFEVGDIYIDFSSDFDTFADNVAYALRTRITYRRDNGRLARGLVRYSGDLKRIHQKNMRRQGSLKLTKFVLDVKIIRQKTKDPKGRWAIGIRFEENLTAFEEGDRITPSPKVEESTTKKKTKQFLAAALLATSGLGCKGDRLREMLNHAVDLGYPANHRLWYYDPGTVDYYIGLRPERKDKLPSRIPGGGSSRTGLPYHQYPFKGKLTRSRNAPTLRWRKYPIRDNLRFSSGFTAKNTWELEQIYDNVLAGPAHLYDATDTKPHASAVDPQVIEFAEHVKALLDGKGTKKKGEESVYHFFKKPCPAAKPKRR